MPPRRKPKKPVLQKQKQRQSQRVVVNINQEKKAKRRRASKPRARQSQLPSQVSFQPQIVMTGGSAPPPPLFFNQAPIQSSGGFNPVQPTPTSLGAPLEVPVFTGEGAVFLGSGEVSVPAPVPVSAPESIIVPIEPVIPDDRPIVMPRPAPAPPKSIISTISPITSGVASLFTGINDLSRETGISSSDVANFMFKRKPKAPPPSLATQEPQMLGLMNPNPSLGSSAFPSTTAPSVVLPQAGFNIQSDQSLSSLSEGRRRPVPRINVQDERSLSSVSGSGLTSDSGLSFLSDESSLDLSEIDRQNQAKRKPSPPPPLNKARKFIKDEMLVAPESFETISTRSAFYREPYKGAFTNDPIIVPPKEVVVLKKPETKRSDPYDFFSGDSDLSSMTSPMKKRPVVQSSESEGELKYIVPQETDVGGRRMPKTPPKINSRTKLADLQGIAEDRNISIRFPDGKKKNRETLRGEIAVYEKYGSL